MMRGSLRTAGAVVALTLLMAGCAAEAPEGARPTAVGQSTASLSPSQSPSQSPSPSTSPEPAALPPGDPGTDAPSVPDPGVPEHDYHDRLQARKVVPAAAMLDAGTVRSVLGGSWRMAGGQALGCVAVEGAVAQRSASYRSAGAGLTQAVTTRSSVHAGDRSVATASRQLEACGWTLQGDPRLGSASTAATSPDSRRSVMVVAAEGVTVTLVGRGDAASSRARWSALADLALGNACAAAPDGCH